MAALIFSGVCVADDLATIRVDTGEKAPRTGDVVTSETTGSVSHIKEETLRRAGATLGNALATVAGTQVRDSGGLGSYSTASLRGSPSDQVMIYLDGMLLNDASRGGVNLSNIDLLQAARVDVYRGATPVQLGIASLGGAINIQTPDAENTRTRLLLGAGSFGSQTLNVLQTVAGSQWRQLYNLGFQQSDNDFPYRFDNATDYNTADDTDTHRNNAATRQTSALIKLDRDVSDASRQNVMLQWFDKRQNIPDQLNSAYNRASLDTQILRGQMQQRWQGIGDVWNSRLSLSASRSREHYLDGQSLLGLERQSDLTRTDTLMLGNYWERISQHQTLSLNGDMRWERFESIDQLGRLPDSEARRFELALALQNSLYFDNERWLVTPSLRYQRIQDRVDVFSSSEAESPRNGRFSSDFLAPQVGVKHRLKPNLSLFGNVGRYQRVPTFFELFGDRGLFVGNDDLGPEKGINSDLGIEWQPVNKGQWLTASSLTLTAFYHDIDNAIARIYDARGIGRSRNIEGAINQGLELELAAELLQRTRLQLNGTFQDTSNQNPSAAFHDRQLPGQATRVLQLDMLHTLGRWQLGYHYLHRSGAFYDTANLRPAADQSLHNLSLQYQWKALQLAMELSNISDEIYEDFNGFPKPGRALFATLTFSGEHKR